MKFWVFIGQFLVSLLFGAIDLNGLAMDEKTMEELSVASSFALQEGKQCQLHGMNSSKLLLFLCFCSLPCLDFAKNGVKVRSSFGCAALNLMQNKILGLKARTSPQIPTQDEKRQEVIGFLHHSMGEKMGDWEAFEYA